MEESGKRDLSPAPLQLASGFARAAEVAEKEISSEKQGTSKAPKENFTAGNAKPERFLLPSIPFRQRLLRHWVFALFCHFDPCESGGRNLETLATYTFKIPRLSPRNDITTQSPREGNFLSSGRTRAFALPSIALRSSNPARRIERPVLGRH